MALQFNPFTGTLETKADNAIAKWNANKLVGKDLPAAAPNFKQTINYNSVTGKYEYVSNLTIVNVLDYIPANFHKFIFDRTLTSDQSGFIQAAIDAVAVKGGTIAFPDGTYSIAAPIILKRGVSLTGLAKSARLKALGTFNYTGTAFPKKALIKTDLDDSQHYERGSVTSLFLDGSNVAEYGIEVIRGRAVTFSEVDMDGCTLGGLYVGSSLVVTSYGIKLFKSEIQRTDVLSSADSVGVHLNNSTDCTIHQVTVVGYRQGFKSIFNAGANKFIFCHAWNRPVNGSLAVAFWCAGGSDQYISCYADTPNNGTTECYGFYVDNTSIRITDSFVFNSSQAGYGEDNTLIGIFCAPGSLSGQGCTFSGNAFVGASFTKKIKQDIGGDYFLANLFNNTSNNNVITSIPNKLNRRLQITGGLSLTSLTSLRFDPGAGNLSLGNIIYAFNTISASRTLFLGEMFLTFDATAVAPAGNIDFTLLAVTVVGPARPYQVVRVDTTDAVVRIIPVAGETINGVAAPFVLTERNRFYTLVNIGGTRWVIG